MHRPFVRAHLETYKPAAPARIHLLLAAVLWSTVGGALLIVGIRWLLLEWSAKTPLLLLAAVAGGVLKSRFVLRQKARKIVQRIQIRGEGRCLGGFISPAGWLMVIAMMGLGRLLRGGFLPLTLVAFIYVMIGTALASASLSIWRACPAKSSRS